MQICHGGVAVVGAGNGGLAIAAVMALAGESVRVYDNLEETIAPIRELGGVFVKTPGYEGFAGFNTVSTDIRATLDGVGLVMVVTPASAHAAVARAMAGDLAPRSVVVLNPGRTGGALEMAHLFEKLCPEKNIVVAEAQTLLYACRKTSATRVEIKGEKKVVPVAAYPAGETLRVVERLQRCFPAFIPATSMLETSFANIGAIFHPTPTLLNTGWIESTHGNFEYYHQGISKAVAGLMEQLDRERLAVASAYGVSALSACEWLREAYGVNEHQLFDAIQQNRAYAGIKAPSEIRVRYLTEDVPTGLVPLACFGRIAGVATPLMDALIAAASRMLNINFVEIGRNERNLGLWGMSRADVIHLATK